jgi:hypothetical protein
MNRIPTRSRRLLALGVLAYSLSLSTAGCGGEGGAPPPAPVPESDPSLCQPSQDPPIVPVRAPDPSARVFWDVSGSMDRFAAKDGPLAALNQRLESSALQGVGVYRFSHSLVADSAVAVKSLPQPLKLDGNWTNLPDVARQAAAALADSAGPVMSIIVSDMLVLIPEAIRKKPNATVCGNVSVPSDPSAPFVFGACFQSALQSVPAIADAYVGVVRVEVQKHAMYVLVVSRDAELGIKAQAEIMDILPPESTSLVLLDYSQARHPVTAGACRFDPTQRSVSLMDRAIPGGTPACRFRFRDEAASHSLNCVVSANPAGMAAVGSTIVGVRRGDDPLTFDSPTGVYSIDSTVTTGTIDADLQPVLKGAFPPESESRVRAFADSSPAADTLIGLGRALATLTPPAGSPWHVKYEGLAER